MRVFAAATLTGASLALWAPVAAEAGVPHADAAIPDLAPLAPFFVEIGPEPRNTAVLVSINLDPTPKPKSFLRFSTVVTNSGVAPLELLGVPKAEVGSAATFQCVSWSLERVCRGHAHVGRTAFHADHLHFHFDDFAAYELRKLGVDGDPDFSPPGLVASSPKVSFCLQDSRQEREDAAPGLYVGCAGAIQGISPGWSDVYDSNLAGQAMSIAGIADGRYALVFVVDPRNQLIEADETNNLAWSVVEISGEGTEAQIVSG